MLSLPARRLSGLGPGARMVEVTTATPPSPPPTRFLAAVAHSSRCSGPSNGRSTPRLVRVGHDAIFSPLQSGHGCNEIVDIDGNDSISILLKPWLMQGDESRGDRESIDVPLGCSCRGRGLRTDAECTKPLPPPVYVGVGVEVPRVYTQKRSKSIQGRLPEESQADRRLELRRWCRRLQSARYVR